MKLGAFTVLEKPIRVDDLELVIERALSDALDRATKEAVSSPAICSVAEVDHETQQDAVGPARSSALGLTLPTAISSESCPVRLNPGFRHAELFALAESAIEANLARTDLDLDAIATLLQVSRWRLSRTFSACGRDFRTCVRQAQMRRAGQIFCEGRAISIKEVAVAVGYLHFSDFTKHFKEHWGMTPSAFWSSVLSNSRFEPGLVNIPERSIVTD